MKKQMIALVAGALMALSANSAFAAFGDLELIRVYYDRAGSEIATDLGSVSSILGTTGPQTFAGSFGSLTNGYAVYFALDRATNNLWVSGNTATPSVINGGTSGLTGTKNGTNSMYTTYNTQGGTNYTGLASATNSYKNKLSATQGTMANAINTATRLNTEASLASIIGVSGASANQALYYWNNGLTTLTAEKTGVNAATIVTNFDGTTTITSATQATPTPIPAAAYLLGSGLLGLVGIRRKANKA